MMYTNPYEGVWHAEGQWLKANFHIHAVPDGGKLGTFKLGRYTVSSKHVSSVIAAYKDAGYDVLMIANQGFFLDTQKYASANDILMVNGIEYVERDGILFIGIKEFIEGKPQEAIDSCRRQGGLAVLCHPNWMAEDGTPPKLTHETMYGLRNFVGIEILTAGIFTRFKGSGLATNVWDEYLSAGKLVWGFANDDFHTWFDIDRGWNVVFSQKRDFQEIKNAIEHGRMYASSGLVLREFSFEGNSLKIGANHERSPIEQITYRFIGEGGRTLQESTGVTAEYRFKGNEQYVRVCAASDNGAMLWTQPIFDANRLRRP
jgi:hypothetical protein